MNRIKVFLLILAVTEWDRLGGQEDIYVIRFSTPTLVLSENIVLQAAYA